MRKIFIIIFALVWVANVAQVFADDQPLRVRDGSSTEVNQLNSEGVASFKKGDFVAASKHFRKALKIDPINGEIYFNEALNLHHSGFQNEATNFFYYAKKYAAGNNKILNSKLLNKYQPAKPKIQKRAPVNRAPLRREGS